MYKLVAIDLDGTMLNQYGIITEKQRKQYQKHKKRCWSNDCIRKSNHICKRFSKEINSNKYFISGNGAITYDIKNNKILYENILSKTKALKIIKICEENSIYYNVYTENGIIAKNLSYNTLYYYKDNLTKPDENRTHINIVENVYDYFEQREEKF